MEIPAMEVPTIGETGGTAFTDRENKSRMVLYTPTSGWAVKSEISSKRKYMYVSKRIGSVWKMRTRF
jgi:hypothetical protein